MLSGVRRARARALAVGGRFVMAAVDWASELDTSPKCKIAHPAIPQMGHVQAENAVKRLWRNHLTEVLDSPLDGSYSEVTLQPSRTPGPDAGGAPQGAGRTQEAWLGRRVKVSASASPARPAFHGGAPSRSGASRVLSCGVARGSAAAAYLHRRD